MKIDDTLKVCIAYVFLIMFGAVVASTCTSCVTSKKAKSVSKTTIDSAVVKTVDSSVVKSVDSVGVKKDNTVTTTEKEDDYKKLTVIEFDSVKQTDPADYFPPVKKITILETGKKKVKATVVVNTSDSSKKKETIKADLSKTDKTNFVKTEVVKEKNVQRTNYWGWVGIVIIIFALWYFGERFGLWRWFIALFKRKDDDYPVKYTKYNPKKPPTD